MKKYIYLPTILQIALFSIFINALMLTGPLYMLQVYDRVLASGSVPTLAALTGLIAGLYTTLGVLTWVRSQLFSAVASRFEVQLIPAVAMTTFQLGPEMVRSRPDDKAVRELRSLSKFLAGPSPAAVFDLPATPFFLAFLFLLHPYFGWWAVAGLILLVSLALLNLIATRRAIEKASTYDRQAMQSVQEVVREVEIGRALGMQERLVARWRTLFDRSDLETRMSGRTLSVFSSVTKAIRLFWQSAILGIGAWLVIATDGNSTPGQMIAASIVMGRAIAPVEQLVGQWRAIQNARESWKHLRGVLSAYRKPSPIMQLPAITGHLSFQAVYVSPPGSQKLTLSNISFELLPGQVLGVIGPSASGKSTLARAAAAVWPARAGVIKIDGADVRQYSTADLGSQIGYMPQSVNLLTGSVKENIARFDPEARAEDVIEAAEAANCHEIILKLPQGYDSQVGPGGAFLSAGQQQRIGLARALFGNPRLVILDEPNSNLDSEGDLALQKVLADLRERQVSTVMITHRMQVIASCTDLMVLRNGGIELLGPRDAVLEKLKSPRPVPRKDAGIIAESAL